MARARSSNVYRSFPDDPAPRYSARPAPTAYRNSPQQSHPPKPSAPQPPASAAARPPKVKRPPIDPEAQKQRKRIAELQKIRIDVINARVCEIVRSIAHEFGDETLIARTEAALARRQLTGPVPSSKAEQVRRYTIYPSESLGAALNARAKAERVDRKLLIDRILAEALGVPLDSVKLKKPPSEPQP